MDRLFPRSVFHALRQAETCLIELDNRPTVRIGAKAEALRLLGRARSELEFLRPDELLDDLPAQLTACRRRSATSARPCPCSTSTPPRGWRGPPGGELTWAGGSGWVHATGYRYAAPVHQSYNEVRLTPRTDNRQNVIVSRVETDPATRLYRYSDYWGTTVTAFDLHAPHKELAVIATSVVETATAQPPVRHRDVGRAGRRRRARPVHRDAGVHRLRRRGTRSCEGRAGAAQGRRRSTPCTPRAAGCTTT